MEQQIAVYEINSRFWLYVEKKWYIDSTIGSLII